MTDKKKKSSSSQTEWTKNKHKKGFAYFLLIITLASFAYRAIYQQDQWDSALLFIFLPACIAIAITLLPNSKIAELQLMKATLLVLLVGMILLPEGLICWLMFMPIALAVAGLVGAISDHKRHYFFLPLLLLGTEGALLGDIIDPNNTVESSIVVEMDETQLRDRLAATPNFDNDTLPLFLKAGFPTPTGVNGTGLDIGDTRTIEFSGEGSNETNQLELTVTRNDESAIVFTPTQDSTMIGQWLTYESIVVSWEEASESSLRVSWEINYTRNMHPGWYFDPLQQYGMDKAAEYLLESFVE